MGAQMSRWMGALLVMPMLPLAQFSFPVPTIPGVPEVPTSIPLPGLGDLLKAEPAISSNLQDARTPIPFLDDFNPREARPLDLLPTTAQGGYALSPGLYQLVGESYCLHAGTHGPGQGDGYLYAPLKGQRAEMVRNILRRSVQYPDIAQRDIQVLLWAVISQTRLSQMSESSQAIAQKLLSEEERAALNGGALDLIPDEVKNQLFANLPQPVRQVLEAEANLRRALTQSNASFEQLERIAVLVGNPGQGEGSQPVPTGRWSYHPNGYFVRYLPEGYSETTTQVYAPQRFQIQQDARGRITTLRSQAGDRLEIRYDDTDVAVPGDAALQGYKIRSIQLFQRRLTLPKLVHRFQSNWDNPGWTLVGVPGATATVTGNPLPQMESRYAQARQYQQQLSQLLTSLNSSQAPAPAALTQAVNLIHLSQALQTLQPNASEGVRSLTTPTELVKMAWQSTVCQMAGTCPNSTVTATDNFPRSYLVASQQWVAQTSGGSSYDGSGDLAMPGNTLRQRLAQSNRAKNKKKAPCDAMREQLEDARLIRQTYADRRLLQEADRKRWTGEQYEEKVQQEVARKIFGKESTPAQGGSSAGGTESSSTEGLEVPMSVDPADCNINIAWDRDTYIRKGYPPAAFDAALTHERYHRDSCNKSRQNFKKASEVPKARSVEEMGAYEAQIQFLEKWLSENCQ